MSVLRFGARGSEVIALQQALNGKGFGPLDSDGIFGAGTEKAVKRFQWASGLGVDGVVGANTWKSLEEPQEQPQPSVSDTHPTVITARETKGYKIYTDGKINIIGVRSKNPISNSFDDELHLAWVKNGLWQHHKYRATCDPGLFWLEHPSKSAGTAILVPGQYEDVYKFDLHAGKYRTLCQRNGKVSVWRDSNKDDVLDWQDGNAGVEGWYGINLHHAGTNSTRVDKWSAGCQVWARLDDWEEAMKICEDSGAETFTYTLITEDDVPEAG